MKINEINSIWNYSVLKISNDRGKLGEDEFKKVKRKIDKFNKNKKDIEEEKINEIVYDVFVMMRRSKGLSERDNFKAELAIRWAQMALQNEPSIDYYIQQCKFYL